MKPCSCGVCGIALREGIELEYHKSDSPNNIGIVFAHDLCRDKMLSYMSGMNMVVDKTTPVEWDARLRRYVDS